MVLNLENQIVHPLANIERKQERVVMIENYLQKIINFKLSEIEPHILHKALNQIYFDGDYMSFSKFKDFQTWANYGPK